MSLVSKAFSDIITFSRSSNATRIGPNGLVQYAPHNLLMYSEQFDNAAWTKSRSSITVDVTTAPDGTATADQSTIDNTTGFHDALIQNFSATSGTTYTFSIFVKKNVGIEAVYFYTNANGNTIAKFNLNTGAYIGNASGDGYTACSSYSSTSFGSGWYRITATFTASSTSSRVFTIGMSTNTADTVTTLTGNGTDNFYIWGAQLSVGSIAGDYTPTTSAAVYGPRFDYDPVTLAAKGLLIEESRTNLVTYSEQFDNADWQKIDATVSSNATTGPDGVTSADSLLDNTGLNRHIVYKNLTGDLSATRTLSVYAKQNTLRYLALSVTDTGDFNCYSAIFDLQLGTVSGTKTNGNGTLSASIQSAGNGWYRCVISGTMATGTSNYYPLIGTSDRPGFTGTLTSNNMPSYIGNGSGIYLWGAQLEEGGFSTSYIPTLASSVTRSADVASVNTLSPWWNASAGTFFIENTFGSYGNQPIALSDQGAAGNAWIYGNLGVIQAYIVGPNINISSGVSVAANTYAKSAFAFGADGKAISANGSTPVVSANTTSPTASTQLSLGSWPGGPYYINGHIKRVAYYPRKLSSAELQALTA